MNKTAQEMAEAQYALMNATRAKFNAAATDSEKLADMLADFERRIKALEFQAIVDQRTRDYQL